MITFLLADDDQDDADLFCESLSEIDQSVKYFSAENGLELIEKLDKGEFSRPDIIFLDINMPIMNGWQCLTELKKRAEYKDIPIVIITTSSKGRESSIAMDLGAFCFFTKPNSYYELKNILEVFVRNFNDNLPEKLFSVPQVIVNTNDQSIQ